MLTELTVHALISEAGNGGKGTRNKDEGGEETDRKPLNGTELTAEEMDRRAKQEDGRAQQQDGTAVIYNEGNT